MGRSLNEIAKQLRDTDKKVQLIYAFNGVGKTRLSREFKELISPKNPDDELEDTKIKVLYYNAFTEDLFYWDNDLDTDSNRKLKIQPNGFTDWILKEQGQERNIVTHFQHYTNDKLTPRFNEEYIVKDTNGKDITIKAYSEIVFSVESGNDEKIENVKISKGEESCLIWCVFYSMLRQIVEILNISESNERETDQFNDLKYVFIDDPVSSLDENHLIELAVNLGGLIKRTTGLKFIISTHNPLFFNVLFNETGGKACYMFHKNEDGSYELQEKNGDSNKSFSYHHYLIQVLQDAIDNNNIQKYHFMLLRNLYEKTANFLGYPQWSKLLPDEQTAYYNRIIQFTSHSTLSNEVVPEPTEPEKNTLKVLLRHLIDQNYYKEEQKGTI